ncbi:MAG: 4Fe-4S binding protein [Elusimicrobia bacterium]|nr:4Fe-4S binding protein [Elusimicrobiota bacterium]
MREPRLIWPWRRATQLLVLASIVFFPLVARYSHYLWARQTEKVLDRWSWSVAGTALRATDAVLRAGLPMEEAGVAGRRPRKRMLWRARQLVGSPAWSARILGVSLTDLLAGLESALASRSVRTALLLGLALPLAGTLLLGRVYCGWLCPMGLLLPLARRLRPLLAYLELPPGEARLWKGNKYALLAAGGALAAVTGLPVLHYLYPPAILSRESHAFATVLFDRAEIGRFGFPWGAFSAGLLVLAAIVFVEVAAAPGVWCASLCPGGALYAALSRWKRLDLVRSKPGCVDCVLCDRACPMQLQPMTDRTGPECDACGVCVDVCPTKALSFRVRRPKTTAAAAALLLLAAIPACAHHIIGIPHYAYDDAFPQAPVLKLREKLGPYSVVLTVYPGNPRPGERAEMHVYVTDPATNLPYAGEVLLEAYRLYAFGFRERIQEPQAGFADMALHKYWVLYPAVANYEVAILLPGLDGNSDLKFPMVVGEPGSPWVSLGLYLGAAALFIVGVRAARIKRARRRPPVEAAA